MQIDYLRSQDDRVHGVNCKIDGANMEVGILCLASCQEKTIRLTSDHHSFIVELPKEFRSNSERVKAFNAILNILYHEQV